MYKFYVVFALVVVFVRADDEPFSIGLGVLSPSYSQTVGKENVKVNFEQKDNGFSYSVGDPSTGSNTYLNFGAGAAGPSVDSAGYAGPNPSAYTGPSSSDYAGPSPSDYAGPSPSAYTGPSPSAYTGPSSSGYIAPQANPSYSGFAGYQAPSYGASSGLGASGFGSLGGFSGFGGFGGSSGLSGGSSGLSGGSSGLSGGSSGFSGLYNGQAASPVSPGTYERKPEQNPSQILPAGFSYHGTEGQSFLRQGDSPNFVISDEKQDAGRGIAEQSFRQGSGKVLRNGLVGYGPGGPRGNLPVGGYAGPQFAGLVKEHGGHDSQNA